MKRRNLTKVDKELLLATNDTIDELSKQYVDSINNDIKYSLEIDPEDKFRFSDEQKQFIRIYSQTKNLALTSDLTKIDFETCKVFFSMTNIQLELHRLSIAQYQQIFKSKILSLDELSSYLSAVIQDDVPLHQQISTKDKHKSIELLLKINELKRDSFVDNSLLNNKNLELEIKDLSIETIETLLNESLTSEDKKTLKELSNKELFNIINETTKK